MIDKGLIPKEAGCVIDTLRKAGYDSFLVGGCVRDLLLGRVPMDFDICTAATPFEVKGLFKRVIDTGTKFGTVTVLLNGKAIEVSTFRKGSQTGAPKRNSHARDELPFLQDVRARDFTINGLLYDGEQVLDFVGGLKDLKERTIKAIGLPEERFREDPLRMMRAVRLGCQLSFTIEEGTIDYIKSSAAQIQSTAPERVRDELVKILHSSCPAEGIRKLSQTGLLKHIVPELEACRGFEQRNPHHNKDVFEHILAVLEYTSDDLILRLAALLHDIGKPETFSVDDQGIGHFYFHNMKGQELSRKILTRLKFDRETVAAVGKLVKEHMSKLPKAKSASVKKLINRVGKSNIFRLIELQIADEAGSAPPHDFGPFRELKAEVTRILKNQEPLSIDELAIGGRDLIEMGFRQGPEIGKILRNLLKLVIDHPEMNTKEILTSKASMMKNKKTE